DALRRKSSAAWIMGEETPRAILLGALRLARGMSAAQIDSLCSGERFAPQPLSAQERDRLETASLDGAPAHVQGDFPEWIAPSLHSVFGERTIAEMQEMSTRAPLDLRVNVLKASREEIAA